MRFGSIVLCRLDSSRLPGKTLKLVHGRPLLDYVVSHCHHAGMLPDHLVVATSIRSVDNPIADYCRQNGLDCFRGPIDDVAARVLHCALGHGFDYFARVNADSPFINAALLDQACRCATKEKLDLVTNLHPRTFPYGVSVELVNTEMYSKAYHSMSKPSHFEHVTQFLYEELSRLRYLNLQHNGVDLSPIKLTVDTKEDFMRFEKFIEALNKPWGNTSFEDAVHFYQRDLKSA